jgi:hypothetical protein
VIRKWSQALDSDKNEALLGRQPELFIVFRDFRYFSFSCVFLLIFLFVIA